MPTPRQIRKVKDFDTTEYFVVHEVIDLPDTDDEVGGSADHEEEARKRIALKREPNQPPGALNMPATPAFNHHEDEFEPQNKQEREWKRNYDAARRQAMIDNSNGSGSI